MRHIRKTHPPAKLTAWLRANKAKNLDVSYENGLSGRPAHRALKTQLLKEQGYLCAYTGREISADSSHMEHLKPQDCCEGHEDVDYFNLVACFPANGGDERYGYGAPMKKSWWEPELFLSPCTAEAERHIKFTWRGKVRVTPPNHEAAKKTVEVLKLDHPSLDSMRRKAIVGFFGYGRNALPLKLGDAQRLLTRIDKLEGAAPKLTAFVFVLKQLLPRYIAGEKP